MNVFMCGGVVWEVRWFLDHWVSKLGTCICTACDETKEIRLAGHVRTDKCHIAVFKQIYEAPRQIYDTLG